MRKQQFKYTTLTELEEGIVYATYVPGLVIDLGIAMELVANRMSFNSEQHFTLIDFTNVRSVTKQARDYMNSPEGGLKGIRGGAFLSNNVVATLFVNLYLKVNNPSVPARFFTNKEDAVRWLKKIKAGKEQLVAL